MSKANITRLTGLDIQPDPNLPSSVHGFYPPSLTTVQIAAIPVNELRNGCLVYNTTTGWFLTYQAGQWRNLVVSYLTALGGAPSGVGLINGGVPYVAPAGVRGDVEVVANGENGFIYHDNSVGMFRVYQNGGWRTVATTA